MRGDRALAGWKRAFPASLLADTQVQAAFARGLDLMNQAMSEQSIEQTYADIQKWLRDAPQAAARAAAAAATAAGAPSAAAAGAGAVAGSGVSRAGAVSSLLSSVSGLDPDDDSSFLSVMLQLGSMHGVEFVPHLRRAPVAGKQVYLFGAMPVYVARGVVYSKREGAKDSDVGAWQPISLADLIEKAKAQAQQTGADKSDAQAGEQRARPGPASSPPPHAAAAVAAAPSGTEDVD